MKWLIFFFLLINFAQAESDYKFRPDYWSKGLHLVAGTGLNAVHYINDDNLNKVGYGVTLKTDLGYYFTNRFALEWSSNVKLNRMDNYFIWDTLMTAGIRYRIKEYFVRGFFGRSPTVVYFGSNVPEEYKSTGASRLQFNGPVGGLAFGKFFRHKEDLIWFLEIANSWQKLKHREAIKMRGEVPDVVESGDDNATVTSLYLTIGVLLF